MLKENGQEGETYVYDWIFILSYTNSSSSYNYSHNYEQAQLRGGQYVSFLYKNKGRQQLNTINTQNDD